MRPRDVPRHEWIGLHVEIVKADNPQLLGLKGTVVDETRNIFTIETEMGEKHVEKAKVTMKVIIGQEAYEVDGRLLVGRPEDRVKKVRKLR